MGEAELISASPPGPRSRRVLECTEAEAAFIAGWLCSDGSIGVNHSRGAGRTRGYPRIRWRITDRDPLERIAAIIKPGTTIGVEKQRHGFKPGKTVYSLQFTGQVAAAVVWRCWEWMSDRYKHRYELAVQHWDGHMFRKLNEEALSDIRQQLSVRKHGTGAALARKYGVSDVLISAIRVGRIHKEYSGTTWEKPTRGR